MFCPECNTAQSIEMNVFWNKGQSRRFVEWSCTSECCKQKRKSLGNWLRFEFDPSSKISAWLKSKGIYDKCSRPANINVIEYMERQEVADQKKKQKRKLERDQLDMEKRSLGDIQQENQTRNVDLKKQRRDNPGATLSSDVRKHSSSECAADAAEKRNAASLSRGIGDVARTEAKMQASKSSNTRHDNEFFWSITETTASRNIRKVSPRTCKCVHPFATASWIVVAASISRTNANEVHCFHAAKELWQHVLLEFRSSVFARCVRSSRHSGTGGGHVSSLPFARRTTRSS